MSFLSGFAQGFSSSIGQNNKSKSLLGIGESKIPKISDIWDQAKPKEYDIPVSSILDNPLGESTDIAPAPVSNVPSIEGTGLAQQFPQAYKVSQALAKIESGGNYNAMGPTVRGTNAIGKYQVMPENVAPWSKAATGQAVTPQQFKASPDLQDRVAVYRINTLLSQGYSPQDVAAIWLSGRPMKGNVRRDLATGVSVPQYINNFNKALGV